MRLAIIIIAANNVRAAFDTLREITTAAFPQVKDSNKVLAEYAARVVIDTEAGYVK